MKNTLLLSVACVGLFASINANAQVNPTPYNDMKWGESFEITGEDNNYLASFSVVDETTYNASVDKKFKYSDANTILPVYYVYNYDKNSEKVFFPIRIYNDQMGGNLDHSFANLSNTSTSNSAYAGAFLNTGITANVNGDFIGNNAQSTSLVYGGAIYNNNEIGKINSDFVGNFVNALTNTATNIYGGAIFNAYTYSIGDIYGDFIGNYAQSDFASTVYAGAIYNEGSINSINGDFINNYAKSASGSSNGGAIFNNESGEINLINSYFVGNYVSANSGVDGGVIFNNGNITEINGGFYNNYAEGTSAFGGAIFNNSNTSELASIGTINADFVDNYTTSKASYGGALYNRGVSASIDSINGDFIGNYSQGSLGANGGAIYNFDNAVIGTISGDFIGNFATSTDDADGGAISNIDAKINEINGNFINNYTKTTSITTAFGAGGGAVYNSNSTSVGEIALISGLFMNNYVDSQSNQSNGGAIYNSSKIGSINANFIDNYTTSVTNTAKGGAIFNEETIDSISGDFEGNYVKSGSSLAYGGAIYNSATDSATASIGNINSSFYNNFAESTSDRGYGGAIYNRSFNSATAEIGDITGDFEGNYAKGNFAQGGAIYNYGSDAVVSIGNIKGNFINNYTNSIDNTTAGAIYNVDAEIASVTGNFEGNNISSETGYAWGGAIANNQDVATATIGEINGNFIGNYAKSSSTISTDGAYGGAVFNDSKLANINGSFYNNYTIATSSRARGGAIYNNSADAKIGDITGDFQGNYVESTNGFAYGGAINNSYGQIGVITGDFNKNRTTSTTGDADAGAIFNTYGSIAGINGNFYENYNISTSGNVYGGAVVNDSAADLGSEAIIGDINGNFINNYGVTTDGNAQGGAIWNAFSEIADITGNFEGNYVISENASASGGAIKNAGANVGDYQKAEIKNITGNFINNYSQSYLTSQGGAITNTNANLTLTDSSFFDNYANSISGFAEGGAIYALGSLTNLDITAKNKDVYFSGNYTQSSGVKNYNSIHLVKYDFSGADIGSPNVNIIASADKNIIFNDGITSDDIGNIINIGDASDTTTTGNVVFNDEVSDVSINVNNGSITLGQENYYTSGMCYGDGCRNDLNITSQSLFDNVNLAMLDNTALYALNGVVQNINLNNFSATGNIEATFDVNLKDETMDKISFNTSDFSNLVSFDIKNIKIVDDASKKETVVNFTTNTELAQLVNYSGDNKVLGNLYLYDVSYDEDSDSGDFNFVRTGINPVATSSVAAREGLNIASSDMLKYLLSSAGDYHISTRGMATGDFNSSTFNTPWVKVYGSSEDVDIDNITVENKTYSGIFGIDTSPMLFTNGYTGIYSIYAAYLGSEQEYDGVKMSQNGAYIGARAILEKGDFFSGYTATLGMSFVDGTNVFGDEDFKMYTGALSTKNGYNINLFCQSFILQPSVTLSYLYVNTPDYENSTGVDISSDDLHVLNITPELKFIVDYYLEAQFYGSIAYNWNFSNDAKVSAQDVYLTQATADPYTEFKLGMTYNISDNSTAFAEAIATAGGRQGFGGQFGVKWSF